MRGVASGEDAVMRNALSTVEKEQAVRRFQQLDSASLREREAAVRQGGGRGARRTGGLSQLVCC